MSMSPTRQKDSAIEKGYPARSCPERREYRPLGDTPNDASLLGECRGAADAGAAEAAVAVRHLGQVLLVVLLGVIELAERGDLGRDRAVARLAQTLAERGLGGLDGLRLLGSR